MSFLKRLFRKKLGQEKISSKLAPSDFEIFFSQNDLNAHIAKNCRFGNHITGGIQAVSVDDNANGTYEVYRCSSRATALQFLRSIPQKNIPHEYYVVVQTPDGNLGKDLKGIYDESTGVQISQEDRLLKVNLGEEKPEFLEKMIRAGQSYKLVDARGVSEEVSVDDMKRALDAKRIMREADEYARAGDYERARDNYFRFINAANFEDDVAYYSLGVVSSMLGYREEALRYAKEALRVNPLNAKAANLKAVTAPADQTRASLLSVQAKDKQTDLDARCPHCGKHLIIPVRYAGQMGKCKYCQGLLKAPER